MDFLNFPGDIRIAPAEETPIGMGKVTLELYSDGAGDWTISFSLSGSGATAIKTDPYFPGAVVLSAVDNVDNPVIIEVWRHRTEEFFMNYLGTFS